PDGCAVLSHGLRRGMEIARSPVVAESLPGAEHLPLVGRGQRGEVREPLHPGLVVTQYGLDTGLLQHDLRYEDPVRVLLAAPGEVPAPPVVEVQEGRPEAVDVEFHG